MGFHGLLWAFVGLHWPLLAAVGLRWPALAIVGMCSPLGLMVGDGKPTLGSCLQARRVELGVRNENPHPRLKFASEGGGVGTGWFMAAGCCSKKKKKNVYIEKTHTYGPKRRICHRLGSISSLQPIQTLFVIVKHK